VSCVRRKADKASPAQDLYTSPWFRKAREFASSSFGKWYILSAKHGLVKPERVLAPYEATLKRMPVKERKEWAQRVLRQIVQVAGSRDQLTVLAGTRYREHLVPLLRAHGLTVRVPMKGKAIGSQLQWLARKLNQARKRTRKVL
jgi:hypothetical protein